jgi:uncharacterized protein YjbI with pentapeptide repeats
MAEVVVPIHPFDPLQPAEMELYTQLCTAQVSHPRSIAVAARPGTNSDIRSAFLQWFFLEALPAMQLPITTVELQDVTVLGMLNLNSALLKVTPRFVNCTFEDDIDLNDATVIGIELISGSAKTILADRLTAQGTVRISAVSEGKRKESPHIIQIRLCGAKVRGNLDLRGCHLTGESNTDRQSVPLFADGLIVEGNALLSDGFTALGEVRLNGCKILRNLDCSGATFRNWKGYSLSAAGANISGSVYLCSKKPWSTYSDGRSFTPAPFISDGMLRFAGATVEGHFDCSGAKFTATAFRDANASTKPEKEEDLEAIRADGMKVDGDVVFTPDEDPKAGEQFFARGVVRLISAKVGGDLYLQGNFDFPGEEPVAADGIVVTGTTFMSGVRTNGLLRLVQADLKQGLYVDEAEFDTGTICRNWTKEDLSSGVRELGGPSCGIYAPDATVGGSFIWKNVKKISSSNGRNILFWLYLPGSKATTIEDDENSWRALDRLDVTGFQYSNVMDLAGEVGWRLPVLDREYAIKNGGRLHNLGFALLLLWRALQRRLSASNQTAIEEHRRRFKPLPYIQFASVLRSAGYENAASDVLIQLERNRTRYSDFGVWRQLGRWSLDWTLLYGFSPFRPVLWILLWALVSAIFFDLAYYNKRIVPAKDNQQTASVASAPRVTFNALIYALDTLIPIVDLNQKKNWVVEPLSPQSSCARHIWDWREILRDLWKDIPLSGAGALLFFNTFFGWLMTTLFVAGVSGLVRRTREA